MKSTPAANISCTICNTVLWYGIAWKFFGTSILIWSLLTHYSFGKWTFCAVVFSANTRENNKAPHHWSFVKETTAPGGLAPEWTSNAKDIFASNLVQTWFAIENCRWNGDTGMLNVERCLMFACADFHFSRVHGDIHYQLLLITAFSRYNANVYSPMLNMDGVKHHTDSRKTYSWLIIQNRTDVRAQKGTS